jgi:hypothetical protein
MRRAVVIFLVFVFLLTTAGVWLFSFPRDKPRASVQFLGYTNVSFDPYGLQTQEGLAVCMVRVGARAAVLQVSNASPFAVVRRRSPAIMFDSPAHSSEYVPTGWNVLQPGECEQFELEPPVKGTRWRLTIGCERLGDDSYGIGPPDFRSRVRRVATWLRGHGVPAPEPNHRSAVQFSSDWLEP